MKYIYSMPMCSACDKLKEEYREGSVEFTERSGDRLKLDPRIFDEIDKEAFLGFQMTNLTFPVVVDMVE